MKSTYSLLILALIATAFGCNKKLEEQPFTVFSVDYYKTPSGFENGVNALYSGMRFVFGPEGAVGLGTVGTDEFTFAEQPRNGAGGTQDFLVMGRYTLDPAVGSILTPWNRSFNSINLANGLLEFAPDVPLASDRRTTFTAEIRFLRAFYYLNLIQYFGAVPVDLGSGDLRFNQQPFQGFNRKDTVALLKRNYEVVIEDLDFASKNLPDRRPASAFRFSKAVAFHMLAKAHIHRAYSSARQGDDFAKGYAAAMEVINNLGKYGTALQTFYADVHRPRNDYNSEILWSIERIPGNFIANEISNPSGIGGNTKGVDAANDFCGDYTNVRAPLNTSATQPVSTRTVLYGRPIRRFCPTPWLYNVAFADKVNDSRYEGSFRTVYIASTTGGGFTAGTDTAFIMAFTNRIADSLNGIAPSGPRLKPYRVIAPREFYFIGGSIDGTLTRNMYPSISKYEDPDKIEANNQGTRPFVVAKLSETYLLAAEAALASGNPSAAMDLINVLKRRAVNRPELSEPQRVARYDLIKLTSTSQVTLDFILDERTRELAGECSRWPDLAVRNKLVERVRLYNSDGAPNVKDFHVRRPIPQSQLNNTVDPNPQQFQNTGY
ncbi:MAG: RagB/SusD family nutrient uptake outer membrane protein [Bacteroidetes bacterium]|uniref:RagB/SusD family nutrient uptake outer membrane protein n=1 Tax=Phnomibacter sp. TaxID=2836217 RepID=UPI002FDE2842|nr:RagB/SusD family nutrient uptake outer membrane protein [Bacteroidota bacterium]